MIGGENSPFVQIASWFAAHVRPLESRLGIDLCCGAEVEQLTMGAVRFACRATSTAVPDQPVTEERPFLARDEGDEIDLNFFGVSVSREV
jgi:hypothetical protein